MAVLFLSGGQELALGFAGFWDAPTTQAPNLWGYLNLRHRIGVCLSVDKNNAMIKWPVRLCILWTQPLNETVPWGLYYS